METPPLLKGYLYGSSRVQGCPRFHACILSKKCQSYDPYQMDCVNCEKAVDPPVDLGGHIPEGEYYPDIQDAVKVLQDQLLKPLAHPDQKSQKIGPEITNEYDRFTKATQVLKHFSRQGTLRMHQEYCQIQVDPELAKLLGRLDA